MKLKPCLWIFIFCHNATARQENWTTRSTIYILKDRTCKDNFIWCKVIYKGVLATDGVRLNLLFWFVNGGSDELHFKESTSLYNKFEFGLICKKAKHARLCQQTFRFCSAESFFDHDIDLIIILIKFCFLLNWQKFKLLLNSCRQSDSVKRNFGAFIFKPGQHFFLKLQKMFAVLCCF